MSGTNRPTTRWSSSTKSNNLINQVPQKKLYRPLNNQQNNFTQRIGKAKNDVEQLFKLYYTTNIQFDTFQKQVVTGTRIPSAKSSTIIPNQLINSSSSEFNSKHCVSREDEFNSKHCVSREDEVNSSDIHEEKILDNEIKLKPIKRTVQVRINNNPDIIHSTSPSPEELPITSNSDVIITENRLLSSQQNEFNESSIMKSVGFIEDLSTDFHEYHHLNKRKPISSIAPLPPVPSTILSSINNRKDITSASLSSFSTVNSLQPSNPSHIVTGTAVVVRERSPTKSAVIKQRTKSSIQQTNLKTSAVSIRYDQPKFPVCLGARVVSIPSKCSRYVLLTFPETPVRYNVPTYFERILLPERFPTLFQNIVHNRNNK